MTKAEIKVGEVGSQSEYKPLTEEALKQLAIDVVAEKVFGSWLIPKHDTRLLGNIFMVMMLVDDIERKRMERDGIRFVYEYWDKAGPRSINGYPIFMSASFLTKADFVRLMDKCKRVQQALDAI